MEEMTIQNLSVPVYRELCKIGAQPVSTIARRLGMKRTSMYYFLERLEQFGIVRNIGPEHMRVYEPASLDDVLKVLRAQRSVLLQKEREFKREFRKK